VENQVWAVIAILAATLLGALFYLGGRIDAVGADLRAEMRTQFGAEGDRIDSMGARIDALGSRIDVLAARVDEQGAQLAERIYEVALKIDDHLRRHAG
jgi:hypothetical protein